MEPTITQYTLDDDPKAVLILHRISPDVWRIASRSHSEFHFDVLFEDLDTLFTQADQFRKLIRQFQVALDATEKARAAVHDHLFEVMEQNVELRQFSGDA